MTQDRNRSTGRDTPFLLSHTGDKLSFAAGLAVLPSFLLHSDPFIKLIQVGVFAVLLAASRKRIRVLLSAGIFASIVVVHLFKPYGSVLFSIGRVTVTEGALKLGITKASTLVGLIFLSRFFIRTTVQFPGRIGRLLSRTFYYFEKITELWKEIEKKPLFARLDELLFALSPRPGDSEHGEAGISGASGPEEGALTGPQAQQQRPPQQPQPRRSTSPGIVIIICITAVNWALFVIALQ